MFSFLTIFIVAACSHIYLYYVLVLFEPYFSRNITLCMFCETKHHEMSVHFTFLTKKNDYCRTYLQNTSSKNLAHARKCGRIQRMKKYRAIFCNTFMTGKMMRNVQNKRNLERASPFCVTMRVWALAKVGSFIVRCNWGANDHQTEDVSGTL